MACGIASPAAGADSWHIATIDNYGKFTSLAVDSGGYSRISYWDPSHSDLKYAWQDADGWHTTIVDGTGDVGICTSLDIGSDGYSRISYTDIGSYDLKYAWQDAGGWHTTTVDGAGDTGWYTSLAIGPDGYSRISYIDETADELRFAWQDSGGWHTTTVDSVGEPGCDTSLAIGHDGYPRICYFQVGTGMKYAWQNVSGWFTEPVFSSANWDDISLVIPEDGVPRICYEGNPPGDEDLVYAFQNSTAWISETVDQVGSVGHYNSLAIGQDGYPRISYYDWTNNDLKYAWQDASGWHSSTVYASGDTGRDTSLALGPDGNPRISFQDFTEDSLKYAWYGPPLMEQRIKVPDFKNLGLITNQSIIDRSVLEYESAPRLPNVLATAAGTTGQRHLIELIPYNVGDRNQHDSGTCWVWTGTAILEASHSLENGYPDILSIQLLSSNYGDGCCPYAGNGGTAPQFADFYNGMGYAIPWSNDNASFSDGWNLISTGMPAVYINTTPRYTLNGNIVPYVIPTRSGDGADQAQAIRNIKSVLDQKRPVFFAFFGGRESKFWNNFEPWWNINPATDIYDFSPWNKPPNANTTGHAVTVVGYYDDGTQAGSYWECLNSWGPSLGHPDGLFRVKMYMDYDAWNSEADTGVTQWWAFSVGGGSNKAFVQEAPTVRQFEYAGMYPDPETGLTHVNFRTATWGNPDTGHYIFGDGEQDINSYPAGTKSPETIDEQDHTYSPGLYRPMFFAMNGAGSSPVAWLDLPLLIKGYAPEARFSSSSATYCPYGLRKGEKPPANFTVKFTDTSYYVPTSWTWNFGDGSPFDHRQNPEHVYPGAGPYQVLLHVTNGYGTNTTIQEVEPRETISCLDPRYFVPWEGYRWKPWLEPGNPAVVNIRIRNLETKRAVPVRISGGAVKYLGTGSPPLVSLSAADGDAITGIVSLAKSRFAMKRGVNRTVTATVDTDGLAPGLYEFTLKARDTQTRKVVDLMPVQFEIIPIPKIRATPAPLTLGTVRIGSTKQVDLTIKNLGNVPLDYSISGSPELVVSPPGGSVPGGEDRIVRVSVNTVYRAQQNIQRSGGSSITIRSNDPDFPELGILVTYTLDAPKAELVSHDIPDLLVFDADTPLVINLTMRNMGSTAWGSSFALGVPDFGDSTLFGSEDAAPVGPVQPGQNATYQVGLSMPAAGAGDYVLAFEMFYTDNGVKRFFGSPVYVPVTVGAAGQPTITGIYPASGPAGATVVANVTGTNFTDGSTVALTRAAQDPIGGMVGFANETVVRAEFAIPPDAETGAWSVVVTNPGGLSATLADGFTITSPAPFVDSVTPAAAFVGTTISGNVTGSGFASGATLDFCLTGYPNLTPTVTSVAPTRIGYSLVLPDDTEPGTRTAAVTNPGGLSGSGGSLDVRWPAPSVTGINPPGGYAGTSVPVAISGSGFRGQCTATLVKAGGGLLNLAGASATDTAITGTVNIPGPARGVWSVAVSNPHGPGVTLPDAFTITLAPAPAVTGISPAFHSNCLVSDHTVSGSNFLEGAQVVLVKAGQANVTTTVNSVTPTSISCTVPVTAIFYPNLENWNVVVTNPDGQEGSTGGFAFYVCE